MGHPTEPQSGAEVDPWIGDVVIGEAGQRLDCFLLFAEARLARFLG